MHDRGAILQKYAPKKRVFIFEPREDAARI